MGVSFRIVKPFPCRSEPGDGEARGKYDWGISRDPYDAAAATYLAHASVQPMLSISMTRALSMTSTGTKTWMPPSTSPSMSMTRALAVRTAPSTTKRDKEGRRCCPHYQVDFQSRSKAGIFRCKSKTGKCSLDLEAIIPIVGT